MDNERIANKLLELKKQIENTQNEIERNEGRLGGLYDELRTNLDLSQKTNRKKLVSEGNKKAKDLKNQINKKEEELEALMQEIQDEMDGWDD